MSGDNEEAGLAAAAGASVGGAAGLAAAGASATDPINEEHPLPALLSIWDCPMINKITGFDDNGKSYAGWTCGWCPLENDGSKPKRSTNATKALVHVSKLTGYDIWPCRCRIPEFWREQEFRRNSEESWSNTGIIFSCEKFL